MKRSPDARAIQHWRSHLTSALGAVVHRPLMLVLVHDAIVDADTTMDAKAGLNQRVLISLGGKVKKMQKKIDL